jgi:4-amino-4-deoxy-L-arabinose transferase-like glycosyltransferase
VRPRAATVQRLIGWALAVVTTIVVVVDQREVGIARDETVYMQHGARYADWWIGLVTRQHGISERSVTQAFGGPGATDNNREHPPVMKTLFGLSERALHRGLGLTDEVTASRLPSAALHGVAVLLVYRWTLALWGLGEAIVAALLLLGLPRAGFHAGLACFDAPTMTLWFATLYAYRRCLDGRRWPWQVGVLWGLALATKHTALLLPFALGVHYLVVALRARSATDRARGWRAGWAVLGHRWRVIASLAVLGPATLYAVWPWLWFAPVRHVRDWLVFHATHVHYNYEYLGHNWNAPPFPWHVALITTLFTVPVATLAAAVIGVLAWLSARGRRPADAPALLLALSAAASIGPFLLGSTPIFGAEKHWMPVLPTICIAAAVGVGWAARGLAAVVAGWWPRLERRAGRLALAVVAGGVVAAAVAELSVAAPYALTWYNALAGGAPGGASLGMNRQFWGVAAKGVLPRLAAEAPRSGTMYVYTHDASPAWGHYLRLGAVPRTLVDAGWEQAGIARSQLAFVIHERHFNRHDYLIWSSYGTLQPSFVLRAAGVPIVSLYRRPAP